MRSKHSHGIAVYELPLQLVQSPSLLTDKNYQPYQGLADRALLDKGLPDRVLLHKGWPDWILLDKGWPDWVLLDWGLTKGGLPDSAVHE